LLTAHRVLAQPVGFKSQDVIAAFWDTESTPLERMDITDLIN